MRASDFQELLPEYLFSSNRLPQLSDAVQAYVDALADEGLCSRELRSSLLGTDHVLAAVESLSKLLDQACIESNALFDHTYEASPTSFLVATLAAQWIMEEGEATSSDMIDLPGFWSRSLLVGLVAASLVAMDKPEHATEAFLAGLFSRVGQWLMAIVAPDYYQETPSDHRLGLATFEAERHHLGIDSHMLGGGVLRQWGFPQSVWRPVMLWQNALSDGAVDEHSALLSEMLWAADLLVEGMEGHDQANVALSSLSESSCFQEIEQIEEWVVKAIALKNQLDPITMLLGLKPSKVFSSVYLQEALETLDERRLYSMREAKRFAQPAMQDYAVEEDWPPAPQYSLSLLTERAKLDNLEVGCLLISIDGEGQFLGAPEATEALMQQLYQRISKGIRNHDALDVMQDDSGILLVQAMESKHYQHTATRLLASLLKEPFLLNGELVEIPLSVGASLFGVQDFEAQEDLVGCLRGRTKPLSSPTALDLASLPQ